MNELFNEFISVEQIKEGYVSPALCELINVTDITELEEEND